MKKIFLTFLVLFTFTGLFSQNQEIKVQMEDFKGTSVIHLESNHLKHFFGINLSELKSNGAKQLFLEKIYKHDYLVSISGIDNNGIALISCINNYNISDIIIQVSEMLENSKIEYNQLNEDEKKSYSKIK
jgi:hypothetical protein